MSKIIGCITIVIKTVFLFSAIAHLDKVKVWGKPIRVTQSKHAVVQMPKEGQPVSLAKFIFYKKNLILDFLLKI